MQPPSQTHKQIHAQLLYVHTQNMDIDSVNG